MAASKDVYFRPHPESPQWPQISRDGEVWEQPREYFCPECGILYWGFIDVKTPEDERSYRELCPECGTSPIGCDTFGWAYSQESIFARLTKRGITPRLYLPRIPEWMRDTVYLEWHNPAAFRQGEGI